MPQEVKLIAEFTKCFQCGSEETISQIAMKPLIASGRYPVGTFSRLKVEVVPLDQPRFAGVAVPCVVTSYDVCAGCGKERCTRSEVISMPIQAPAPPPGNGHGGFPRN
jgi:hypothetical protein